MKRPSDLIYDRSVSLLEKEKGYKNDVVSNGWEKASPEAKQAWSAGFKCALSADMLNRMEQWVQYLAERISAEGYEVKVAPARVWSENERVYREDVDALVDNIVALKDGLRRAPGWNTLSKTDSMNIYQANGMEYDLQLCYNLLENMASIYPRSGQGFIEAGFYVMN